MPRRPGLDAARALAVCAMVVGHSLHAVLSSAARASPGIALYWQFRSTTAPLFLLVAGAALMMSATRHESGPWQLSRRYLPRVALLFGLGVLLRFPLWGMPELWSGDRKVWSHLLAFDALHCIASGLLLTVLILMAVRSKVGRTWCLLGGSAVLVLAAPAVHHALSGSGAPLPLRQWLGGGTPTFPLFPWSAFFLIGALLAMWLPQALESRRGGWGLLLLGAALAATAFALGSSHRASAHPLYFLQRLGMGVAALGLITQLPSRLQAAMAPWGRTSLWVYVLHLPVVYGWGYWSGLDRVIGPRLSFPPALGVGLLLLGASLLLARAGSRGWARLRAGGLMPREERPPASPASP